MPNDYPRDDYRDSYRSGNRGPSRGGPGGGGGGPGRGPRDGGGERRGIPLSELDPTTTEASRKVIGCAIEVHKTLGPGYEEAVYAAALMEALAAQGVTFKQGQTFDVKFADKKVGEVKSDLFVESRFLVEVMARPGPVGTYERLALRAQLKAADLELGLIVNFAERRLKDGLVRVVNVAKLNLERDDELDDEGDGAERSHDFDSH